MGFRETAGDTGLTEFLDVLMPPAPEPHGYVTRRLAEDVMLPTDVVPETTDHIKLTNSADALSLGSIIVVGGILFGCFAYRFSKRNQAKTVCSSPIEVAEDLV